MKELTCKCIQAAQGPAKDCPAEPAIGRGGHGAPTDAIANLTRTPDFTVSVMEARFDQIKDRLREAVQTNAYYPAEAMTVLPNSSPRKSSRRNADPSGPLRTLICFPLAAWKML